MKLARVNHIGVATRSVDDTFPVIASKAKQSSGRGTQSGLPRRYLLAMTEGEWQ